MAEISAETRAVVEAIQDLTRVTIALHGNFASKSEAIRRLTELSVPPARIAAILAVPAGDVRSALAKAKKRASGDGAADAGSARRNTSTKGAADTQGESAARGGASNGEA